MESFWFKWLISENPRQYLETNPEYMPRELLALQDVPQHPKHHPEGDAYTHTLCVVDAMKIIMNRDKYNGVERHILLFSALCHDFGKASTTRWNEEKQMWTSYGHDKAGVLPTKTFLKRIGVQDWIIDTVSTLVELHMMQAHMTTISDKAVRKFVKKLNGVPLEYWMAVVEADVSGRPPLPARIPETAQIIYEIAQRLKTEA